MPRASWAFLVLPLTIKKLKPVANLERSVHARFWINFQPQKLWRHFYFWRGGSSLLKQCEYFPTDPCHCPPHLVVSCHSSAICHLALLSFFFFFWTCLLHSFIHIVWLLRALGLWTLSFPKRFTHENKGEEKAFYTFILLFIAWILNISVANYMSKLQKSMEDLVSYYFLLIS